MPDRRGPPYLALYVQFGVAEVRIVDLAGAAVETFRDPAKNAYGLRKRRTGGMLAPVLLPAVEIDIGALLA
jgi:hypothetical protein